jgi:uncharacterized membrane protein YcgQ (UPF0703/DUF1980 family)
MSKVANGRIFERLVELRGQYAAHSDRLFNVVRFRRQCCAADAIPYAVPVFCHEGVIGFKENHWVEITARVEFRRSNPQSESYVTILIVPKQAALRQTVPDLDPYLP